MVLSRVSSRQLTRAQISLNPKVLTTRKCPSKTRNIINNFFSQIQDARPFRLGLAPSIHVFKRHYSICSCRPSPSIHVFKRHYSIHSCIQAPSIHVFNRHYSIHSCIQAPLLHLLFILSRYLNSFKPSL